MKIKKFIKQLYIGRFCSIYSKQYAESQQYPYCL